MGKKSRNFNINQTDGGYGWIVVACTFVVGFIIDGLAYSFGIVLVELLEQFKQDRASTVVVGSILTGVMYLIGPLAGALSDIYGCRIIVFLGAVISSVGFVISSFATSVLYLYFSYGLLGGLGFGFMFLPAGVCVIQHFTKRRALANGIAVCGSGVGTFVMNHLTRYMLDHYGWRGTVLLFAGIALQGAALGLLLLPPLPKLKDPTLTDAPKAMYIKNINADDQHSINRRLKTKSCFSCFRSVDSAEEVNESELKVFNINDTLDTNVQLSRYETNMDKVIYDKKGNSLKRVIQRIFSSKLLTHGGFILFLFANFAVHLAFTIPFNLLPDQAVENGMTKHEASWLISSIGITNTLSRIFLGWLADRKCVNRMVMLDIVIFLAGIITGLSPLLTTFQSKLIYPCLYGVMIGGYVTLCPVVLADLFGTEMIAQSFGMWLFACGLAGTISSPIGGWLYDTTNNYDITFVIAGAEFLLAGLLFLASICVSRNKK
ncbi:monocarboxylate transporter 14-like [Mercenaria mercenaria]|uniref:monocarboxylate transporter 14-like n=1 Tax=Mercenaria mercenaria TaxID=6596 RepID=UPI00234E8ADF|nr:monocarboxylate transporter 14-like [Mercenaria mercenaria]